MEMSDEARQKMLSAMAKEAEKSCGGDFSKLPLDDLRADPADELSPAAKKEVMDNAAAALTALASG